MTQISSTNTIAESAGRREVKPLMLAEECPEGRMPEPPEPGDPGVLFFGGHRRSGTTWLTSMLNSHPEVHIRNEGWLINDRECSFFQWFDRARFDLWAGSREALGTWLSNVSADDAAKLMQRAMLTALLRESTRREGWKEWGRLRWIGDKTTMFYLSHAPVLRELFPPPGARFLSMLRDGRDAVVSDLFLMFREGGFASLPPECSEHAVRSFEHHVKGKGPAVPLFSPGMMRYFVLNWVDAVYQARRAAELYGPAGFLEVRYEELVNQTDAQLARVFRWLGVDAAKELVSTIVFDNRFEVASGGRSRGQEEPLAEWRKGVVGDWQHRFTPQDKEVFKSVAGALLIELGYAADNEW